MSKADDKIVELGLGAAIWCTTSPHEWKWSEKESLRMARALCVLRRQFAELETENKKLKKEYGG
jgi:hypothetical protein